MDLIKIYKILIRRIWYLILIPLIAAITAFLFTLKIPNTYISTAQLSTGYTTKKQFTLEDERLNLRQASVKFNNLIQMMNSEIVLSLLSYRLILHDLKSEKPFKYPKKTNTILNAKETNQAIDTFQEKIKSFELLSKFDEKESELIDLLRNYGYLGWQLKENLNVRRVKDTDFVSVQYVSEDPLLSAFVVNTLSKEFIRYDNYLKSARATQAVSFFAKLVKEKKEILDDKTDLLNAYKSSNKVVNYEIESGALISQITQYELKKEEILNRIQSLQLSISSVEKQLSNLNNKSGSNSNKMILEIREKINELNRIYIETGSNDKELLATINNLRERMQIEMNKTSLNEETDDDGILSKAELKSQKEQYELELQIAQSNLRSVNSTLYALKNNISGFASKEATVGALEREVEKATEEYLQAVDKYNTEKNKALIADSPVQLMIKGQPSSSPQSSKKWLIVAFSVVASFSLCAFVIVVIEMIDSRIKSPARFDRMVGLKLIGAINYIDTKKFDLNYLFNKTKPIKEHEIFKHFLRKIRYEIGSTKAKVLLITSTRPGEGKTFITIALAYSLSLLNKRILIIDTNFKHNSLTELLLIKQSDQKLLKKSPNNLLVRVNSENGSNFESEYDTSSIISKTNHQGIDIIGNYGGDESPMEIFTGRNFKEMVRKLSDKYDYLLLEGAALNNYSDTKELVEYVDKIIPVFSAESTIKDLDHESIDYLEGLGTKFPGAVLNKVDPIHLVA